MPKLDPVLKAALRVATEKGWADFSLSDLKDEKGLNLAKVHAVYRTKFDVLVAFSTYIDRCTLEDLDAFDETESPKDRLFSVTMSRFDALGPHKEFVRILWSQSWCNPSSMLCSLPLGLNSMDWMLKAAGFNTEGLIGMLRVKGFAVFYLSVVSAWLSDDSEDMGKTMVAVDSGLDTLQQLPGFL